MRPGKPQRRTRFLTNLDDGKIHGPRAFNVLVVGFLAAVVSSIRPEDRRTVATEVAGLVRAMASLYGLTLDKAAQQPEPPGWERLKKFPIAKAMVAFWGTLASRSAPGVQEAACRTLRTPEFWTRVLSYIEDPVGFAKSIHGEDGVMEDGIAAMGLVTSPTKGSSS